MTAHFSHVRPKGLPESNESHGARPHALCLGQAVARALVRALWFGVSPALLAACIVRHLVPPLTLGCPEVAREAVRLANENALPLGAGLFLLFATAAHYWRFVLPGGAFASPLSPSWAPRLRAGDRRAYADAAALEVSLRSPRLRKRIAPTIGAARLAELDVRLDALRSAIEADDEGALRGAANAVRAHASSIVARAQWREGVAVVLAMAAVAGASFGVRARIAESYSVLSGSMLPTLRPDDRLIGNRLAFRSLAGTPNGRAPKRGDMVVFKSLAVDGGHLRDIPEYLVKRVIGLPGDRISMHHGVPVINGWTVPVCDAAEYLYVLQGGDNGLSGRLLVEFLDDRAYLTVHAVGSADFVETYDVQPGEVFVLGDNRNNSSDSRAWNEHRGGGVAFGALEARIERLVASRRGDQTWDLDQLLRPIQSLATEVRLDGVELAPFREGIGRCLSKRPERTTPPPRPPDSVYETGR